MMASSTRLSWLDPVYREGDIVALFFNRYLQPGSLERLVARRQRPLAFRFFLRTTIVVLLVRLRARDQDAVCARRQTRGPAGADLHTKLPLLVDFSHAAGAGL